MAQEYHQNKVNKKSNSDKPLTDPSSQRFIEGPSINLPEHEYTNISIGGSIAPSLPGDLRSNLFAGLFLYGLLYAECGTYQFANNDANGAFPITAGIRGLILHRDNFDLGLGYQYYDIRGKSSHYFEFPKYRGLHWLYCGLAWLPGRSCYEMKIGMSFPTYGDKGFLVPKRTKSRFVSVAFGMSVPLSEHWKFIIDASAMRTDIDLGAEWGWYWLGFRYFTRYITLDIATVFGLAWAVMIGVPIY